MARRSGGLGVAIKVVKAIDRASKQAERERQRRNREIEREAKARQREDQQAMRAKTRAEAQATKDEIQAAKECFDDRAKERRLAKEYIISEYMR